MTFDPWAGTGARTNICQVLFGGGRSSLNNVFGLQHTRISNFCLFVWNACDKNKDTSRNMRNVIPNFLGIVCLLEADTMWNKICEAEEVTLLYCVRLEEPVSKCVLRWCRICFVQPGDWNKAQGFTFQRQLAPSAVNALWVRQWK